jgi:hypothetical protein
MAPREESGSAGNEGSIPSWRPCGVVRHDGGHDFPRRDSLMRFFSTVLAVAALALVGASSQGAMAPKKSPVPAVIPKTTLFRGWVTVTINGQTFPGYADWRGFPDSVPTGDPNTWVFVGSGSSWRLLSQAELRAATVRLVQLDMGYSNGPFKPGTKATGM